MIARALSFPDDVAVAFLQARVGTAVVLHAPARGRMRVPDGASVHLWAGCPIRGLGMLRADDVASIQLDKKVATDTDFARLAHLTGLRELNASKSHAVGDAGLAAIALLRRLRVLDLYASAVTDAGLAHLAGMPELENLHLGATRVAGPGLAHLVGLQRLTHLSLHDTEIGDEAIPHLLRLRALQKLVVAGTRITTRGLARLRAGLPGAREVYMPSPGRRLARERARSAVLAILARRLRPDPGDGASPEQELRALLPRGSRIAEIRVDGGPAEKLGWKLDELEVAAITLPQLGTGCDLRIVTPAGLDVWVPWLRARRADRRRVRRASIPPRAAVH